MVIVTGTLGNIVGSLVAYYVGKIGGRAVINRYGRYRRLSERHLEKAEQWFGQRGEWAVFVGRLLPGIRTFISLPSGIAKTNIVKFNGILGDWVTPMLLRWVTLGISSDKTGERSRLTHIRSSTLLPIVVPLVGVLSIRVVEKPNKGEDHASF